MTMKKKIVGMTRGMPSLRAPAALIALVLLCAGAAQARDPVAGQKLAAACAACHGLNGLSTLPNAPHLAGQPAIYVTEQLKNYRNGSRKNEVMAVIAKPLTDDQIDDLAAWYASIQITATVK